MSGVTGDYGIGRLIGVGSRNVVVCGCGVL